MTDSLIWSEEQILNFYDAVYPWISEGDPWHTEFFCLAARKKYMTEEQKRSINLGDTCMMFKTIIKDHNPKKFLAKVHQADASADYFTDRDGNYIPKNCIVYYININRTNVLKAMREFKGLLNEWDYDLGTLLEFNNTNKRENIGNQLKTVQNNLLKSFQDPKNIEGDWLDIDCDFGTEFDAKAYKEALMDFLATTDVYVVSTHGGCHILISKSAISEYNKSMAQVYSRKEMKVQAMTLEKILTFVRGLITTDFPEADVKEIKLNQNQAIPLPGTFQGDFPVSFV